MDTKKKSPNGHAYRANLINGSGRVQMSFSVAAETDAEAHQQVVGLTCSHTVELFDRGRLVAALKVEQSRS